MAKISLLSPDTINKIAAGEVVERPASAVKELVENAVDAEASAVTVEIRDGGISLIRVTDNGSGIPASEVPAAFLRHSTSKIRDVMDLMRVNSLGFRGEALSSIAAVARVEMITRTGDSLTGIRYRIEGGKEIGTEEVGAPEGTTVIVRDLFYHTPVRRKFLKAPSTEAGHVVDAVEKLALSHPEISFRMIANGKESFHTSGNGRLSDIIFTVYGRETAASLIPVEAQEGPYALSGYIGKPVLSRGSRSAESFFVNNRYVKNAIMTRALENAFQGFVMQHRFPFAVLFLAVDPSLIDVNVHPAKRELRFVREDELYPFLYHALRKTLERHELVPEETWGREEPKTAGAEDRIPVRRLPEPFEKTRLQQEEQLTSEKITRGSQPDGQLTGRGPGPETEGQELSTMEKLRRSGFSGQDSAPSAQGSWVQASMVMEEIAPRDSHPDFRLIGQVFRTYWLIETPKSLFLVDQHAAHEKVLFEKVMHSWEQEDTAVQQVNPPVILTLSATEADILNRHEKVFAGAGFDVRPFGGREYALYGVPYQLLSLAGEEQFRQMLAELSEDGAGTAEDLASEKLARVCCKAAVKGNMTISPAEAEHLIGELLTLDHPYTCPHGRPTMIEMTRRELDRKFRRIP